MIEGERGARKVHMFAWDISAAALQGVLTEMINDTNCALFVVGLTPIRDNRFAWIVRECGEYEEEPFVAGVLRYPHRLGCYSVETRIYRQLVIQRMHSSFLVRFCREIAAKLSDSICPPMTW